MYGQKKNDELYHHGILGQKWGIRRYQNPDGTLTTAGKKRYNGWNESKNYENRLNDLETAISMHKADSYKARVNSELYPLRKGNWEAQTKEQIQKMEYANKKITEGKKEVEQLIKEAKSKGLTINAKTTLKSYAEGIDYYNYYKKNKGEDFFKDFEPFWTTYTSGVWAKGNVYKVK